jgi:hypothetical protein
MKIVRNILAVILGAVIGSVVNGFIISISGKVIPPPADVDVTTMEGLKATMHLFEPKHFLMPFLAHALGTFVGALIAILIAASHKFYLALSVSVLFLIGGIINVYLLPSPFWFTLCDLILAYIPMGLLARLVVSR